MQQRLFVLVVVCLLLGCGRHERRTYYADGSTKSLILQNEDSTDGEYIVYRKSGAIKSKGIWKNGPGNGTVTRFFPNGAIEEISHWRNGRMTNEYFKYYPNGKLEVFARYENGQKIDFYKVYDEAGNIYNLSLYDKQSRLYYLSKWNKNNTNEFRMFLPIFDINEDIDSIKFKIHSEIHFRGEGEVTIGTFEEGVFTKISPTVNLPGDGTSVALNIFFQDKKKLFYRFDFRPTANDSLPKLGLQKRIIPIEESENPKFDDYKKIQEMGRADAIGSLF